MYKRSQVIIPTQVCYLKGAVNFHFVYERLMLKFQLCSYEPFCIVTANVYSALLIVSTISIRYGHVNCVYKTRHVGGNICDQMSN